MFARARRTMSLVVVIVIAASLLCSSLPPALAEPASGDLRVWLPLIMKGWRPTPTQTLTPTRTLTPGGPTPTRTLTPVPPSGTSDELIDAALARGEISAETALIYKVFASFKDPRLPAQFKGDDHLIPDSHIVDRVLTQYATLSAATQTILNPFLIPPLYEGSWMDPLTAQGPSGPARAEKAAADTPPPCAGANWEQWDHVNGMHSNVRFWWLKSRPADAAVANAYLAAMDNDIWPKLTTLMGHVPVSDAAVSCNGGSGDLDVYLVEGIGRSFQASHAGTGCGAHPTYIVMDPTKSRLILAHEFTHTIQKSFAVSGGWCNNNFAWLSEATAMWAEDYVYPSADEEHGQAPWFYDPRGTVQPLELRNDHHEYGAYLFFFFATHYLGDNALIGRVWASAESNDSVAAVDQAIPGGFAAVWDKFAVYNWNRPPYDFYQQWDQLNLRPAPYRSNTTWVIKDPVVLNAGYLADNSPHLSLTYQHFKFEGVEARLITFYNGLTYWLDEKPLDPMPYILPITDGTTQYDFVPLQPDAIQGVKVQALFKIEGQDDWVLEDWTNKPYVSFCRDAKAERLQELVIIYSNSEFDPPDYEVHAQQLPPTLRASDMGCWRYGGSASAEMTGQGSAGHFEDRQQLSNVAFERTAVHPDIPYPVISFQVVEGQWQRTYDVNNPTTGCSGHASDSASLSSGNTSGGLGVLAGAKSGPSLGAYAGGSTVARGMGVTIVCPDGSGWGPLQTLPWFAVDLLTLMNGDPFLAKQGGLLKDSGDLIPPGLAATMHYVWDLAPLREP
jgi:hypothetical protein